MLRQPASMAVRVHAIIMLRMVSQHLMSVPKSTIAIGSSDGRYLIAFEETSLSPAIVFFNAPNS